MHDEFSHQVGRCAVALVAYSHLHKHPYIGDIPNIGDITITADKTGLTRPKRGNKQRF